MVATDSLKKSYGSPFILMMMRLQIFGTNRSACLKSEFNVAIWPITSGLWAYLVHVVHVLRFIMIVDLLTVLKVVPSPMKTVTSKCGTLFSCKMSVAQVAEKMGTQSLESFQQKALIQV